MPAAKKKPRRSGAFWSEGVSGARGLLRLLRMLLHHVMGSLVLGLVMRGHAAVGLHAAGRGSSLGGSRRGGDRNDRAGNQHRAEDGGNELLEHRRLQQNNGED